MRLANAKDEIVPLNDLRAAQPGIPHFVLLSRVVSGSVISTGQHGDHREHVRSDLRFLEEMYNRINEDEATVKELSRSGAKFDKEFGRLGNPASSPWRTSSRR